LNKKPSNKVEFFLQKTDSSRKKVKFNSKTSLSSVNSGAKSCRNGTSKTSYAFLMSINVERPIKAYKDFLCLFDNCLDCSKAMLKEGNVCFCSW